VPRESQLDLGNGVTLKLVLIPAGKFLMGSPSSEYEEGPQHEVTISTPFYMGIYEVTQEQYQAVMGAEPWRGKVSLGGKIGQHRAGENRPS
jgi:formylglycine-generating enzyme required for sulfatase activity